MRKLIPLVVVAMLCACDSNKSQAEEVVRMNLKDPDSARFGEFYFNTDTKKGCLVVNAKNSMGGYTGDRVASVKRSDAGWEVIDIDDDGDRRFCQEYHADKKD